MCADVVIGVKGGREITAKAYEAADAAAATLPARRARLLRAAAALAATLAALLAALAVSDAVLLWRTASARVSSARASVGDSSATLRVDADVFHAALPGGSAYSVERIECELSAADAGAGTASAAMLATASGHVADIDPANVRGDGSSVSIAPGARARYAAELVATTPDASALVAAARGASATAPVYAACAVTHALRLLGAGGVPVRITTRHSYALSREALGVDTVMPKLTPDALEIADVSLEVPTVGSGQVSGGVRLTAADSGMLAPAETIAGLPPPPAGSVDFTHLEVVEVEVARVAYAVEAMASGGASIPPLELASEHAALALRATPDGARTAATASATASVGCADGTKTLMSLCESAAEAPASTTMAAAATAAAERWGLPLLAPKVSDAGRSLLAEPVEGALDVSFAGYASDALCRKPAVDDPHFGELAGAQTQAQLTEREIELVAALTEGSLMGALLGELHDFTAQEFGVQEQHKASWGALIRDNTAEDDEEIMRLDTVSSRAADGKFAYKAVGTIAGYQVNMTAFLDDANLAAFLTVDEEEPEEGDDTILFLSFLEARVFNQIEDRHMQANFTVYQEGEYMFEAVAEGHSPDDTAAKVILTVRADLEGDDYDNFPPGAEPDYVWSLGAGQPVDDLTTVYHMEVEAWEGGGHAYGPHEAGLNLFVSLPDNYWLEHFNLGVNNTVVADRASAVWSLHAENYDWNCPDYNSQGGIPCAESEDTDATWSGYTERTGGMLSAGQVLEIGGDEALWTVLTGTSEQLDAGREVGNLMLSARLDGTPLYVALGGEGQGAMGDGSMGTTISVEYDGQERLRTTTSMSSAKLTAPQGTFRAADDSMGMRTVVYIDGSEIPSMDMNMSMLMGANMLTCARAQCGLMASTMSMNSDGEPLFTYDASVGRMAMVRDNGVMIKGGFDLYTDQWETPLAQRVPTLGLSANASSGDSHAAGGIESLWEGERVMFAVGEAESQPANNAGVEDADASFRVWVEDAIDAEMTATAYAGPITHGGELFGTLDGTPKLRLSGEGLHSQPHATNPHLRAATADLSVYAGDEAESFNDLPLVVTLDSEGALGDAYGSMEIIVRNDDNEEVYHQSGQAWTWTDATGDRLNVSSIVSVDEGTPINVDFGGLRRADAMGNNLTVTGEDMHFDWKLMGTTWDPDALKVDLWVRQEDGNVEDESFSSMDLDMQAEVTHGIAGVFCMLPGVDGSNSLQLKVQNEHQGSHWDPSTPGMVADWNVNSMSLDAHMSGSGDHKEVRAMVHTMPDFPRGETEYNHDLPDYEHLLVGANASWGLPPDQLVPDYIEAAFDLLMPNIAFTYHDIALADGQFVGPYAHVEAGYQFVDLGIMMDDLVPEAHLTVTTAGEMHWGSTGGWETQHVSYTPTVGSAFIRYDEYSIGDGSCATNNCYILRASLSMESEYCQMGEDAGQASPALQVPLFKSDFACAAASESNGAPPPVHVEGLMLPTETACPVASPPPLSSPTPLSNPQPPGTPTPALPPLSSPTPLSSPQPPGTPTPALPPPPPLRRTVTVPLKKLLAKETLSDAEAVQTLVADFAAAAQQARDTHATSGVIGVTSTATIEHTARYTLGGLPASKVTDEVLTAVLLRYAAAHGVLPANVRAELVELAVQRRSQRRSRALLAGGDAIIELTTVFPIEQTDKVASLVADEAAHQTVSAAAIAEALAEELLPDEAIDASAISEQAAVELSLAVDIELEVDPTVGDHDNVGLSDLGNAVGNTIADDVSGGVEVEEPELAPAPPPADEQDSDGDPFFSGAVMYGIIGGGGAVLVGVVVAVVIMRRGGGGGSSRGSRANTGFNGALDSSGDSASYCDVDNWDGSRTPPLEETREKSRDSVYTMNPMQSSAPPLPPGGLPEGWTTEQWEYYGHDYLLDNQLGN